MFMDNSSQSRIVNLLDVRKGLTELREGLKAIREDLAEHFTDLDREEKYGKQMWSFAMTANSRLEDLADDVMNADTTFVEVIRYYGEEDNKNMTSSEFYGIFKTFVTSYKVRQCSVFTLLC